jgi:YHS domain-containing protein
MVFSLRQHDVRFSFLEGIGEMIKRLITFSYLLVLGILVLAAFMFGPKLLSGGPAGGPEIAEGTQIYVNSATGIAINGYDPVAYFTQSAHVEGSADFAADWAGASWHFSSAENRDLFLANPDDYAPQYGGYCAFALAQGAIATTVPEAWSIHNGKLYLNNSLGVRSLWQESPDTLIERADIHWPDVLQ